MFQVRLLASTSVLFTLTTVQVPNLALTQKKWTTVYTLHMQTLMTENVENVYCNPLRRRVVQKFGIFVGLNGRLVEAKISTFKCPKCVY